MDYKVYRLIHAREPRDRRKATKTRRPYKNFRGEPPSSVISPWSLWSPFWLWAPWQSIELFQSIKLYHCVEDGSNMTRLRLRRRLRKGAATLAVRQQCGKRRAVWHGGLPRYDPPAMYWYTDRYGWGCLRLGSDI